MNISADNPFETEQEPLVNEINMTPFIDVMLVLLIVFMVTLPVINHAVKVTLPKAVAEKTDRQISSADISIQADGTISWNKQAVDDDSFKLKLEDAAKSTQPPVLHIYSDQNAKYSRVAFVMSSAQHYGISQFDFVMDPPANP